MLPIKGLLFDLDGVLVTTEHNHFLAWQRCAHSLDIPFTENENELLKGVSRVDSLKKILELGNKTISSVEFEALLTSKNDFYLESIQALSSKDLLPGVAALLQEAKNHGILLGVGSSSKNAKFILRKLNLYSYFDAIVDGNSVKASKPDPEGFILASKLTKSNPEDCVVFEDSEAGIIAGNKINMTTIGIGVSNKLEIADKVYKRFEEIKLKEF